jgi:hypothetical protein
MPDAPMPLKIVLGLAATAVDEARKLPETLPAAVSKAPVFAVTTAMGASLRLQQRLTELSIRGEQLLSQLRGTSEQPPSWATFDDPPSETSEGAAPRAAFDLIDYQDPGDDADDDPADGPAAPAPAKKAAAKKAPAKTVKKAPSKKAPLKGSPAKESPAKESPAKESPAEVAAKMAVIAAAPAPPSAENASAEAGPGKAAPQKTAIRRPADDLAGDLAAALEDSPEA